MSNFVPSSTATFLVIQTKFYKIWKVKEREKEKLLQRMLREKKELQRKKLMKMKNN